MKNLFLKSIFLTIILALTFSFGCFDDSGSDSNDDVNGGTDATDDSSGSSESADGVFAKLIVGRIVYAAAPSAKIDKIEALFSGTYDPCATESDLHPSGVTCNSYTLELNNDIYQYPEIPGTSFLTTGADYTFNVVASSEVPELTASIDFVTTEPIITSPSNNTIVSSSSGFTVEWSGSEGSGTVQIILLNNSTAENVTVEPADTGTYTFSSADLAGITPGACYLQLEKYNQENISATGYDSRSIIRARHMCSTFVTLE